MQKLRRRRCKVCREWFIPRQSFQNWCSPEHGFELSEQRRNKDR
ncbi:NinG family protein, partial [Escherichia coli]|nr:NinG family protein [Escherichia coli]